MRIILTIDKILLQLFGKIKRRKSRFGKIVDV